MSVIHQRSRGREQGPCNRTAQWPRIKATKGATTVILMDHIAILQKRVNHSYDMKMLDKLENRVHSKSEIDRSESNCELAHKLPTASIPFAGHVPEISTYREEGVKWLAFERTKRKRKRRHSECSQWRV